MRPREREGKKEKGGGGGGEKIEEVGWIGTTEFKKKI